MTNEEALKWLTDLRSSLAVPCGSALSEERKQFAEAVDVAIEALKSEEKAEKCSFIPEKVRKSLPPDWYDRPLWPSWDI